MKTNRTLAIIVNYHSTALCLEAVRSVLSSRSIGPVSVVVVDNSADASEAAFLREYLPADVHLRVNPVNMGFGKACNCVFEKFDAELILLLNPDARLLTDCLIQLQRTLLSSRDIGAVGPQIYWDHKNGFLLPPSYPPLLIELEPFLSVMGDHSPLWKLASMIWRKFAVRIWKSQFPVRVMNLSGGHVLLKKEAVITAGGLFDPRFFLYFEDMDLFVRLRKTGYRLFVDPRAQVVHHYDQCDWSHTSDKRAHMAASRKLFVEKYLTGWKIYSNRLAIRCQNRMKLSSQPERNAMGHFPFQMEVPDQLIGGWLFEWSPNSNFIPAAGRFGTGPHLVFTKSQWELLAPGLYYGRLGGVSGWEMPVVEITWEKQ